MTVPITAPMNNPITGVFGSGNIRVYGLGMSGTFTVPVGVTNVRVRLWGGGGYNAGSGGGFALKTIYGLVPGTAITVTVGAAPNGAGGTSSFGSYVSATGGGTTSSSGGTGVGGDINTTGGASDGTGSGGSASLFGNGGVRFGSAAGGGGGSNNSGWQGGSGFTGNGGMQGTTGSSPSYAAYPPNAGNTSSIDYIGTGGGGGYYQGGVNGGGGGEQGSGGYPAGGGGAGRAGGAGLVIVEW